VRETQAALRFQGAHNPPWRSTGRLIDSSLPGWAVRQGPPTLVIDPRLCHSSRAVDYLSARGFVSSLAATDSH